MIQYFKFILNFLLPTILEPAIGTPLYGNKPTQNTTGAVTYQELKQKFVTEHNEEVFANYGVDMTWNAFHRETISYL